MESINNKVSKMWDNEALYNSYYLNYEFADFYTGAKILGLGFNGSNVLKSVNNPYIKKYNKIEQELLEYEAYSILFIVVSENDKYGLNALKDNIDKLKESHDLLIGIILDENGESDFDNMFNAYFFSKLIDVNFIINGFLGSFILTGPICLDPMDIINFFRDAGKLNFYVASGKIENKTKDIVNILKEKCTLNTTDQFITIFCSNLITMFDVDEIAWGIVKNDEETNILYSAPGLCEILDGDEICCVLFSN